MAETHVGLRLFLGPIRWFGILLLTILGPFRWAGRRAVPRHGGVLILANHISDVDPIVVQAAIPRHVFFMAKEELFAMRGLGSVIRWFQAFPVRRGEPDRGAIKLSVRLLKAGEVVCVFPEGRLSQDGRLQPILPGVALIARMAEVPVVCCGISGSNRIMPYGKTVARPAFGWVSARFGAVWTGEGEFVDWVSTELSRLSERSADR